MNLQGIADAQGRGGKQCERMQTARTSWTNGVQPRASVNNDTSTISSSAVPARHKGKGKGGWRGKDNEEDRISTGIRILPPALAGFGSIEGFSLYDGV